MKLNNIKNIRLSKCSISDNEIKAVQKVLESEYLGMGTQVLKFEQEIKKYIDTDMNVVCVNTGTSALQLALSALGIGRGDEVLVPSLTYVGGFQAISAVGAIPIACEINKDTLFIDALDAEARVTERTKAIMPVHYASSSKGISDIYALAHKYKLRVVEDAAQAFGCKRDSKKIGIEGDIVFFSFDGIKNITSGEGGAVLTRDETLLEKLKDGRLLGVQKDTENRFSGKRSWDFDVENQGFRFHMSNINAAIGIEQLKRIENFKERRQTIVRQYLSQFENIKSIKTLEFNYDEVLPHIFVIKVKDRDRLRQHLSDNGIECGIHYKPNHLLAKYRSDLELPITESVYKEILTLPCHVDLTNKEQDFVIEKVKGFYAK